MNEHDKERLSLISVLAERHPSHHIGRTALMKYMVFSFRISAECRSDTASR